MEHVYAAGVSCVQLVQDSRTSSLVSSLLILRLKTPKLYVSGNTLAGRKFHTLAVRHRNDPLKRFSDLESVFATVNKLADPHHAYLLLFPIISVFDSVFGAQYLLAMATGEWLNAILKWLLSEHRPYWYVRESDYYATLERPILQQYAHTCETGPGCPSGHVMMAATEIVLILMWISHVMADRKCYIWWLKYLLWPLCTSALVLVMLARMFVATHFPHQCVLGALCGFILAPALCIYVSDPFIWGPYPVRKAARDRMIMRRRIWLVAMALSTMAISVAVFWGMKALGYDPQWSIKLAFKWCANPESIKVTTTPMFALVEATSSLLGWAVFVLPEVANYRHYTKERSLLVSVILTVGIQYLCNWYQDTIDKSNVYSFYANQILVYASKPLIYLRFIPYVSMFVVGKPKTS